MDAIAAYESEIDRSISLSIVGRSKVQTGRADTILVSDVSRPRAVMTANEEICSTLTCLDSL